MSARPGKNPQYVALARELISGIESGRFPVGSLLPTEMVLCREFGMSRITVRAALRELEVRGLVTRRAGIGTRVETALVRNRFVHSANAVDEFLHALDGLTFRQLKQRNINADAALAAKTGCRVGQPLLNITSLRVNARGVPVCLTSHYLPEPFAAAALGMDGRTGSLGTRVALAHDTEIAELRQIFDAQNLTAAQAKRLQAKPGEAALETTRWYYAVGGRLVLYSNSLFPRGRAIYDFRSRKESMAPVGARAVRARKKPEGTP